MTDFLVPNWRNQTNCAIDLLGVASELGAVIPLTLGEARDELVRSQVRIENMAASLRLNVELSQQAALGMGGIVECMR